jgi:hypothetical protein
LNHQLPVHITGYVHPTISLPIKQVAHLFKIDNWIKLSDDAKRLAFANLLFNHELINCKSDIVPASIETINNIALSAYSILTYCSTVKNCTDTFPTFTITYSNNTNDLSTFSQYVVELHKRKQEYILNQDAYKSRLELEYKDKKHDAALAKWKISNKFSEDKLPTSHIEYLLSMLSLPSILKEEYRYILSTPTMVLCFAPRFKVELLNGLIDSLQSLDNYSITKYEALKQLLNKQKIASTDSLDADELASELEEATSLLIGIDPALLTPIERIRVKLYNITKSSESVTRKNGSFTVVKSNKSNIEV